MASGGQCGASHTRFGGRAQRCTRDRGAVARCCVRRLPSFNDFSPGIIKDVRKPLEILDRLAPDIGAVVAEWDRTFFGSAGNKRASTNIPATLTNLGLMSRIPL